MTFDDVSELGIQCRGGVGITTTTWAVTDSPTFPSENFFEFPYYGFSPFHSYHRLHPTALQWCYDHDVDGIFVYPAGGFEHGAYIIFRTVDEKMLFMLRWAGAQV
jgi:hypothetical protein